MRKVAKGFTMVELSLSVAFIAILSIIVVVIIGNAVSAYHRGLTLNQLNTAGMDTVEEMRATVQSSPARSAVRECTAVYNDTSVKKSCEDDNGMSFIYRERNAKVKVGSNEVDVPVYGAFCTGAYSYLWNAGYFFNGEYKINGTEALSLVYKKAGSDASITATNFKLLKIQDENRLVCKLAAGMQLDRLNGGEYWLNSNYSNMPNEINVTSQALDEDPIDLLEGNNNLAIYDLTAALPAEGGDKNMLYAVSFILGTVQGGVNVGVNGNYCTTPGDYENASVENFDYCAINKFNFAAQATGG